MHDLYSAVETIDEAEAARHRERQGSGSDGHGSGMSHHHPPLPVMKKRYAYVQKMNKLHHCPKCFFKSRPKRRNGKKH